MIDKKAIIQATEIPSIPEILQKILLIAEDPLASSRHFEQLVVQEPGLVTHLLKMVNSAFYARAEKVDSIQHAIVLLGMNTVSSIASGLILINSFHNLSGVPKEYVRTVFRHSIVSANLINVFAGKESIRKREPLYLAGMVYDIGHLILGQHFREKYMCITQDDPFPPIDEENRRFEVDHSDLGSELLNEWKFPDDVVMMVRYHHNSEDYDGDEKDISYLKACDFLSKQIDDLDSYLSRDEDQVDGMFSEVLDSIGWNWSMVQESRENIFQAIDLARGLMNR
jgi:HD-like signal output (HDOD) protein